MASSIIHYAITCELIKRRQFNNPDRLKLGSILVDSGYNGNSHMKISVAGGHKNTYDLDGYKSIYGELMKQDDLYLGYYLHLIQDILYRHLVYDKYHWNPLIPGNVEKLHRDYAIGNFYVVQKYNLKNEVTIPADFDKEPINQVCSFDLEGLVQNMNSYFEPIEEDDIFFFTKEMADEYIAEAVGYCIQELDNLECQNAGTDGYLSAWNRMPKSILESTMNTRELGMYRIQGTKNYTLSNRIYRSDRCESLSASDKKLLLDRDITTIIDLRSEQEAETKPSAFSSDSDFIVFHYPIVEGMLPPNSLEAVPVSYMEIAHADCVKEVFKTIADANGGVLFHCTAGKDRTGVVSAILLALVGVSDEDTVYDYAISREFNKQRLEAYLKEHPEIDKDIVLANEKSMYGFLRMLREKHNSVDQYLRDIGISEYEIQELKSKLI
ncbi:MAG: tyrosine-protein phosphatase [Lachnospiraceae bacterium]|nr:tyrosine-protein phosphatase [Lachnospiraceae bacterium]